MRRPLEDDIWELYDTRQDFNLANDLAAQDPDKLKAMQALFLSEAVKCYYSPPFWYKIGILILATIFTFTLRRRVLAGAAGEIGGVGKARWTAFASLGLWFSVAFSGRWIAFY